MRCEIFAVYDTAAKRYLDPFPSRTVETAIREFRRAVNTEGSGFNQFPADYVLFHIGTFDQLVGAVESFAPRQLGVALEFYENPHNDPIALELEA